MRSETERLQSVSDRHTTKLTRKEPTGTLINKDKQTHTCTCPHTARAQTDSPPLRRLAAFLCRLWVIRLWYVFGAEVQKKENTGMFHKTTQQQQQHIVNSNIQYMNTDTKNSLRVMFYSQRQWGWLAGKKIYHVLQKDSWKHEHLSQYPHNAMFSMETTWYLDQTEMTRAPPERHGRKFIV